MPKLFPEDQEKVDQYLSLPQHRHEREDFKPIRLLLVVFATLTLLTVISYIVAKAEGLI